MSDSSTKVGTGLVIGTAGHIDHGKTSLVHALTGIDTDRLAEEKRRGISIDLGFAHLTLPDGLSVSFVDVPGHERFIKNMLAGAAGISAVMLIVAADESVKPQTREHFEICRLLGITDGLVALTKVDLASRDQIESTRAAVKTLVAGSFLEGSPVCEVSAHTGDGLDGLRQTLSSLRTRVVPTENAGLARLPVDRSFALKGFGTVVTGTLRSGSLQPGATIVLHPSNKQARIRGLQVHGQLVEVASAGQRTAVNLSGIEHAEIHRGDTLTLTEGLQTTKLLDVSVEWLDKADAPATREEFLLHIGTAEVSASLKVLESGSTLCRLHLAEPVLALPGDRFILRRPSPARTVAGGSVVDAFPPARLNRAKTLARLNRLVHAEASERIHLLVQEGTTGRSLDGLVRSVGVTKQELEASVQSNPELLLVGDDRVLTMSWIDMRRRKLVQFLTAFHAKYPSAPGTPVAVARLGLDQTIAAVVFDSPLLKVDANAVSLVSHQARFSSQESQALAHIESAFREAGFTPPAPAEVLNSSGADPAKARGLLETLIKSKKLVRISEALIFHADVVAHIRKSLAAHKGRRFSVPEFKEWTSISRKYAIPLLEYLDHEHVTRREGDSRVVL